MNTKDIAQTVEDAWAKRVKAQDLKSGTKKYFDAQAHFFAGAMNAMQAVLAPPDDPKLCTAVPPKWVIAILSDRDILKF